MSRGPDGALHVLHVDNHLLVVHKPACLPCVPDESGDRSLLDQGKDWLRERFDKPGNVFLGVVHRLDRPVSGVVAFARTSKAAARLSAAFRDRQVEKLYWGLAERPPHGLDRAGPGASLPEGRLEAWLRKDRARNRVVASREPMAEAKRAVSLWRLRGTFQHRGATRAMLELVPETGRSHQLRLAARSVAGPLLGDLKYGASFPLEDASIALHARALELTHPTTKERLRFEAAVPENEPWQAAAALLGEVRPGRRETTR